MRIDAHQHFWRYDAARFPWITAEMSILQRDYLPDDLISSLQRSQVDATIAVQAEHSETETQFLLELAAENLAIAGVIGWTDLSSPKVGERLAQFRRFKKLRGFRHIVQAEPDDDFLFRSDFRRGISQLADFGFTYDILIYARQLPAAVKLVAAYPNQQFVLDHIAKPLIKSRTYDPWRSHIRELAQYSNVFCKVSGLVTEADWSSWRQDDFKPYLDAVFAYFGPERLMFGSDWPVCLIAANYSQVFNLISEYAAGYSKEQQSAIFGANAARFYGLNEISP
jgi:L-fuconolactonase